MNRYERAQYLERLVEMRDAYERRGAADRYEVMSIEEAIEYAERAIVEVVASELEAESDAASDCADHRT